MDKESNNGNLEMERKVKEDRNAGDVMTLLVIPHLFMGLYHILMGLYHTRLNLNH